MLNDVCLLLDVWELFGSRSEIFRSVFRSAWLLGSWCLVFCSTIFFIAGDRLYTILHEVEIVNTHNSFVWNALPSLTSGLLTG